jgi:hypothetical protein
VREFRLVPFPEAEIPAVEITAKAARQGNLLSIHYSVQGDIGEIRLPARSGSPARKHDLWKATCFEFFLAVKDRPEYWEFNLSPSGDWNVYAMDGYRQVNMREESAYLQLPFEFTKMNNSLSLDAAVSLSQLFQPLQQLQIGITAIIQTVDGKETYWALAHPGAQADFHLKESFVLEL